MITGDDQAASGRAGHVNAAARSLGDWLPLAAAPTFAMMALLAGLSGGAPDMVCSAMPMSSPLSGMVPMYLLMSAFHLRPWLRRFAHC